MICLAIRYFSGIVESTHGPLFEQSNDRCFCVGNAASLCYILKILCSSSTLIGLVVKAI